MLKIFYNPLKPDSIEVSNEDSKYNRENLLDDNQGSLFKTTTITENTIRLRFAGPTAIQVAAILNHNFVTGDYINFEASNDNFAHTLRSVPIIPGTDYVEIDWQYLDYQYRYRKFSGSFVQIGELFLAEKAYTTEVLYNWGYKKIRKIERKENKTFGGNVYREKNSIIDGWKLPFSEIPDSQQAAFEEAAESDYSCFVFQGQLSYGFIDADEFTHNGPGDWSGFLELYEKPK